MFTVSKSTCVFCSWTVGLFMFLGSIPSRSDASTTDSASETLTDRTGYISSPSGHDTGYCKYWFIKARANATVTIRFELLDIETNYDGTCNRRNFVKLGPDPEITFCGTANEVYIARVRREHVWVRFNTTSRERNRFRLRYIVGYVPTRVSCDLYESKCGNGKCIPNDWWCNDEDECGDGSDETYCKSGVRTTPRPTTTASMSRRPINVPGYRTTPRPTTTARRPINVPECGEKYLNGNYGNFSSPSYPYNYPNNADCSWTISSDSSLDKIQLRFSHFRLQEQQDTDYVSVYDGRSDRSALKGVYYGGNPPPQVIESSSNSLYVKFHSDGSYTTRGFMASYQKKGMCMPGQQRCLKETECYFQIQQCDGVWNCPEHGSDEAGCGRCPHSQYTCGSSSKCYSEEERCNGKSFCLNNADESNCTSKRCGPHNGLFLCRNERCIYESWECDRTSDCDDHSDEDGCPSPFFTRRVIVAAVAGSLICSLLLVIALGCICKVYALRMHEQYGPRHESPLSRLQAEIFRRRAPPPPYHEAMLTSRPYEEARREFINQSRDNRRRRVSDRRRNRALPPTPEEPSMHQIGTAASGADPEIGSDDDVPMLSLNSTNQQNANTDSSSTTELIPPTTSSDSEDNEGYHNDACDDDDDDDDDDNDSVLLDLSEGDGGTVTWRSLSRHTSEDEHSPEHVPSDGGCDSVDSASANISVDDMSLALHETLDKENGVEAEIVDKESSVDQDFPATSQSSISTSVPEEQFNTVEPLIKNQ